MHSGKGRGVKNVAGNKRKGLNDNHLEYNKDSIMKVLYLTDGVLQEAGTIRIQDDKVIMDLGEHNPRIFSSVY